MGEGTVLLRRSSLGDVILLGAVTAAIPGPVTVVTAPPWLDVARRLRGVDRVVAWPEVPPGRIIDLQGSLRSRRLAPLSRCIRKRSLQRRLRLWTGWGGRRLTVPEIYAEACGVRPLPAPWIDVDGPRTALALIPGAAWVPKQWTVDRLIAVGRAWDGPVAVLGGPGEEAMVDAVARAVPGAEGIAERGFTRTIAALGRTAVAVSGDTGLMHLAGACGAAVVALFGPTHPDDGFFVYRGEVVQRAVGCRPCTLHRVPSCARGDRLCMDLAVDAVIEAVQRCAG